MKSEELLKKYPLLQVSYFLQVNVKNTDFNNKNNIPAKNFQKHKFCIVDTPGHATFSNVRSRGVQVTDLVILVIAADSGIQEQTLECLNLIKAADSKIYSKSPFYNLFDQN